MTQVGAVPPMPSQVSQAHQASRSASAAAAASKDEVQKQQKKESVGNAGLPPELGRPAIQTVTEGTEETGESAATEASDENLSIDSEEREILKEMSRNISETSRKVAKGVNKSALRHMAEKGWFKAEHVDEATSFFAVRIPKVLSDQLSKYLNETLGINEAINSKD